MAVGEDTGFMVELGVANTNRIGSAVDVDKVRALRMVCRCTFHKDGLDAVQIVASAAGKDCVVDTSLRGFASNSVFNRDTLAFVSGFDCNTTSLSFISVIVVRTDECLHAVSCPGNFRFVVKVARKLRDYFCSHT